MRLLYTLAFVTAAAALLPAGARERLQLEVRQVEGIAKVQRAGGSGWETLTGGGRVASDDLLETAPHSRLFLTCGAANLIIAGPSTKALVSLRPVGRRTAAPRAITLTLFSGGAFVAVARPCSTIIYTAAAVVESREGALAVAADPLSGETGVQVLCAESVFVRTITKDAERVLVQGQTTVVRAGAQPAAPQSLSETYVAMLGELYGDTLVRRHISACGVRVRAEVSGGSDVPPGTGALAAQAPRAFLARPTTYRRLFRPNEIWGAILEDRRRRFWFYAPVAPERTLFENRWTIGLDGGAAFTGGAGYGRVTVSPAVHWRWIDAALELELARNWERWTLPALTDGLEGVLDLVRHVTIGRPHDSLFLTIGRLSEYSIADGLVVQRFTNRNPYSLFHPLGLYGQAMLFDMLCLDGFVADISQFTVGGLHAYLRASGYYAGAGYYYDVNQYHALPGGDGNRFEAALPDTIPPGRRHQVHVCEINLGTDIVATDEFAMRLMGEIAYRFKTLTRTDGYVLRVPSVVADWKGMQFSASFNQEVGRLISGQFGWMYPTNRYRVTDGGAALLTQNGMLSAERVARGFLLSYRYAPVSGLSLECEYRQDLLTRSVYADSSLASHDDFDYFVAIAVNERLVPFLQYARVAVGQVHGGIYPPGGTYSTTWGLHGSLRIITRPLVAGIAFEAGAEYYALDRGPVFNNRLDSSERIWEFFAGARWGFR